MSIPHRDKKAHINPNLEEELISELEGQMYLTTEGIFGVPLGVSAGFVFLFVLFGSLLERAGAGEYFIKLAYAMLGKYSGGPAKASIVASGLTGIVSGRLLFLSCAFNVCAKLNGRIC